MATTTPFVRLTKRLTRQVIFDHSGFSISGTRVVPYPDAEEHPAQALFVRRCLARGVLEEASRAEYEEQEEVDEELARAGFYDEADKKEVVSYQEHLVVDRQKAAEARVRAKRAETEEDDETELEALERRRAELLAEQEELGLTDDDPEAQVTRALPSKSARAAKKAGKATTRRKSDTTSEPENSRV